MVKRMPRSQDQMRNFRCLSAAALVAIASHQPASAQAGGQEVNAFELTPRIGVSYDSNVFQINSDRFEGSKDDIVATPAVSAAFNRTIGRNSLRLNVDAGYTLHDRYKDLNQLVLSGTGSGSLALSSYCLAYPTASITKQQNNITASSAIKNSQTFQDYAVTVSCQRPFGFYPSVTVGYQTTTNGDEQLDFINQHTFRYSGGIGYATPTIGSLLLTAGQTRIRQPNRDVFEGVEDGSDVMNVGLTFSRAVAPRVSFSAGVRYLSVDPLRTGTQSYNGLGYSASINYHPSPRLTVIAAADRDVTGSGNVAVSYVLASTYSVTGTFVMSPRTTLRASAEYFDRSYRGESTVFFPFVRGDESGTTLNGSVNRAIGARISLSAFASYTTVGAQGNFYDYNRIQAGLSAGLRL